MSHARAPLAPLWWMTALFVPVLVASVWWVSIHASPFGSFLWATAVAVALSSAGHRTVRRITGATARLRAQEDRESAERIADLVSTGRARLEQAGADGLEQPASSVSPSTDPSQQPEEAVRDLAAAALSAVERAVDRQQVEVFLHIARRLQLLVMRALTELNALEREVEDPDLMEQVWRLDHLVTQLGRQVESLGVLGGATPRTIKRPVPLVTALRQSVAEVEQYARVRVPVLPEGSLHGHVATDVIHLLAELVENATNFSPPTTRVRVMAEHVPAGLAVEIEDRGLSMSPEKLKRMNGLLARPDQFDIRRQLKDGQLGLYVCARLAGRHRIRVWLRTNAFGGTQAVVILPRDLLVEEKPVFLHVGSAAPDQAAAASQIAVLARTRPEPGVLYGAPVSNRPEALASASLPQRRRDDTGSTSAAVGEESGRPSLPLRSEAPQAAFPLRSAWGETDRRTPAPADLGLMGRFAAGTQQTTPLTGTDATPD